MYDTPESFSVDRFLSPDEYLKINFQLIILLDKEYEKDEEKRNEVIAKLGLAESDFLPIVKCIGTDSKLYDGI